MQPKLISVIVPLYNEEEIVKTTASRLVAVTEQWEEDYEIIFINDGSSDRTLLHLNAIVSANLKLKVISFSRNFGHQMAFTAGLDYACGDAIIVIDGDLQDPPEVMNDFIAKWKEGYQVVYGRRAKRRGENLFKLATAAVFYRMLNKLVDIDIPKDVGDFRLMDRVVVDSLKQMPEKHRFIRGMVAWVGFKQSFVEYEREARIAGETKFPFKKMLKFALDGIFSFSTTPLKVSMVMGVLITSFSFLYMIYVVVMKLLGYGFPGYASLVVFILFLGGVQLISIGILGQYIGRTFEGVKDRPLYIVDQTINMGKVPKEPLSVDSF